MQPKEIIDAYCRIRTIDHTISDDVLDFMKDAAIEQLKNYATGVPQPSPIDKDWLETKMDEVVNSIEVDSEGLINHTKVFNQVMDIALKFATKSPSPQPAVSAEDYWEQKSISCLKLDDGADCLTKEDFINYMQAYRLTQAPDIKAKEEGDKWIDVKKED